MSKQVRVNVRCNSTSKPREEMRNGRKVVVVSSATMPDDVVMNNIKYQGDEIAKSFSTLNRAPAPLGHPMIGGAFVSARDPEAINMNHVGAWNENVRREKGRVFLDKVIDVEVANRTESGRALMSAINEGKPIHTSTGLLANLEDAPEGSGAKYLAKDIIFDHDAILLNEKGAATPEQGVGMFVNSEGETIEVVNSMLEDVAARDLEWAADMAVRAVEKMGRASLIERVATAIKQALTGDGGGTSELNNGESEMDEKKFSELSAKVDTVTEKLNSIDTLVANAVAAAVKPLTDNLAEITAANAAKDAAELADLRAKIVKANVMSAEAAAELTLNAARALAPKTVPGKAAGMSGAFTNSSEDEFAGVDLNAGLTAGGK